MNKIISQNIDELRRLCKELEVARMYAFGSVCTVRFSEKSDIDFLISFNEIPFEKYSDNYFILLDKLEILFKRKIDLVTEKSLTNPFFIESVNKTKILIYGN